MKTKWIVGIVLILIVAAFFYFNDELSISLDQPTMTLDGQPRAEIQINEEEAIDYATLTGKVGASGQQVVYSCVPYASGGVTQTCRDAGYQDSSEAIGHPNPWCSYGSNHPIGSVVRCFKNQDVPISDVTLYLDGQEIWSCSGDCSNQQFTSIELKDIIHANPECASAFNNVFDCRTSASCTGSRSCYLDLSGTTGAEYGVIENMNLDASGGLLCTQDQQCGAWSSCSNGERSRTCVLTCPDDIVTEIEPCNTCSNGIQDQDEEGIDCGGVCPECDPGDGSDTKTLKPFIFALISIIVIILGIITWRVMRKR